MLGIFKEDHFRGDVRAYDFKRRRAKETRLKILNLDEIFYFMVV